MLTPPLAPKAWGCFPRAGPRGPKGGVESYKLGLSAGPGPPPPPSNKLCLGFPI